MKSTVSAVALTAFLIGQTATPVLAQSGSTPQSWPTPLPGPVQGNDGFAGTLRCDARSNKVVRCNARHQNRVQLIERHGGTCQDGRDWGYDRRSIWVSRKCKASFAYGYGNYWPYPQPQPQPPKDKGPSTGLIIGGVVVAAGLAALLLSKKKKGSATPEASTPTSFPPQPPATIVSNLSSLTASQRPVMQTCLSEAARQLGVTGGSRLSLDAVTETQPGNGGWRFRANLTGTYPDGDRDMTMYCRATPTKVVQLDFS